MSDLHNNDLQIKLAFLERHVEEQDKVILALRNDLSALQRELTRLHERIETIDPGSSGAPPNERPPHY